ncbi:MAG: hypothetical protein ACFFD2_17115, partial [Promethearchaeota archaeon]
TRFLYRRARTSCPSLSKFMDRVLAMELYYHAMLTTINYIVKVEPNATLAEQTEISEKAFNNYLYGIRL